MKKISLIGILVSCFILTDLQAQKGRTTKMKGNTWQTLSLVTLDRKFDEMLGFDIEVPRASDNGVTIIEISAWVQAKP